MQPVITGLFTLLGALIGAFLAAMRDLWKGATDFRVAVRMVRSEIERNRVFLKDLVAEESWPNAVKDDAWQTSQRNLALLLSGRDWDWLTGHYALLSMARQEFERRDRVGGVASPVFQDVINSLHKVTDDMAEYEKVFSEIGANPLWGIAADAAL